MHVLFLGTSIKSVGVSRLSGAMRSCVVEMHILLLRVEADVIKADGE
jgi:hypothetical protein